MESGSSKNVLLQAGKRFRVIVVDSRPHYEGRNVLAALSSSGIPCVYLQLNSICLIMKVKPASPLSSLVVQTLSSLVLVYWHTSRAPKQYLINLTQDDCDSRPDAASWLEQSTSSTLYWILSNKVTLAQESEKWSLTMAKNLAKDLLTMLTGMTDKLSPYQRWRSTKTMSTNNISLK